eukprot:6306678-Amphidinium_carterae.1
METRWNSTVTDVAQTFSATPPFECLRMLLSMLMTPLDEGEQNHVMVFIDITRAHPHCRMS